MARSIRFLGLSMVAAAAVSYAIACGDGELSSTIDEDGGEPSSRDDAQAPGVDAEPSRSTLRLAHLAWELGPVDFCYQAARSGSFEGPVLGGGGAVADAGTSDADASDATEDADTGDAMPDGSARGIAYRTVTKYFTLDVAGTINLAIVRAGAPSCGDALARGVVTLDPGKLSTVALFDAGDAGSAPALVAFTDDRETKADRARVRMIHGAAGSGVLAVRVEGAKTTQVAAELEPRKASSLDQSIPVDALGFATIEPVAPPAAFVVTPGSWRSAPVDLDLRGDSLHTGFVVDGADGGFEVLWCADKSTTAELTACILLR